MANTLNLEEAVKIIKNIAHEIKSNTDYLTRLDQAIGDGDHGINLNKGFNAVLNSLDDLKVKDIGGTLKSVGMTLLSTVGGAVGPLYGMAFMKAGSVVEGKNEIDVNDLVKMFEAAEKGIMDIGKGRLGEKTMLDAIHPAITAMREAKEQNKSLIETFEIGVKVGGRYEEHYRHGFKTRKIKLSRRTFKRPPRCGCYFSPYYAEINVRYDEKNVVT